MIDNLKTQGEWKIQVQIAIIFCFLKILTKLMLCIKRMITKKL